MDILETPAVLTGEDTPSPGPGLACGPRRSARLLRPPTTPRLDPPASAQSTLMAPPSSLSTPVNKYPRLLPPPIPNILTAPYEHALLARVTAILRGDTGDVFNLPHEVNLAFVALCHYNLVHFCNDNDRREVQRRLESMSGSQLVALARDVQRGIADCKL